MFLIAFSSKPDLGGSTITLSTLNLLSLKIFPTSPALKLILDKLFNFLLTNASAIASSLISIPKTSFTLLQT